MARGCRGYGWRKGKGFNGRGLAEVAQWWVVTVWWPATRGMDVDGEGSRGLRMTEG